MANENHKSPNAIPPRTSSYGINGLGIPQKSVLRPLAETDWISSSSKPSGRKHQHSQSSPPDMSPTPLKRKADALVHDAALPWTAEKEKMVLGPYDYLVGHPGKDFRTQMITAFNRLLRVPEASLAIITKVVGMLHTASLL
jgi:geranylgeranyl diphosphate synthase, type III